MQFSLVDGQKKKLILIAALPIVALAAFCIAMIVIRIVVGLPSNQWDAAAIVEADRFARGLPLYQDQISGHPQWVYGPGMLLLGGLIFHLTGPSLLVMQSLSLGGAAVMIWIAWAVVRPWLSPFWQFLTICSLLAIETKVAYFGTIRPDFVACALALGSMVLCYRGGAARIAGASVMLVASFLTKQPMIVFSVVPPLACLAETGLRDRRALFLSLVPGVCLVVSLICMKLFTPLTWFYMIDVPRRFAIDRHLLLKLFFGMLGGMTMIWVALGVGATHRQAYDDERLRRLKCVAIGLVITVPFELLAYAKDGGMPNSMIPAFVLMVIFAYLLVSPIVGSDPCFTNPALAVIFLLSLPFTFIPISPARAPITDFRDKVGEQYREVIARVRTLDDTVLSPDDPTISLFARGQHDRTLVVDLDTLIWPKTLPVSLDQAYSAHYIVRKMNDIGSMQLDLAARGYRVIWKNRVYAIWARMGQPARSVAVQRRPASRTLGQNSLGVARR